MSEQNQHSEPVDLTWQDFEGNRMQFKTLEEMESFFRWRSGKLVEQLEAAQRERDLIGTALGEPCAECGHIDWRSDGYAPAIRARLVAADNLAETQDAVISLMVDYVEDLLARACAFNESKRKHPEANTGAYPLYAASRLDELMRKVTKMQTDNHLQRDSSPAAEVIDGR